MKPHEPHAGTAQRLERPVDVFRIVIFLGLSIAFAGCDREGSRDELTISDVEVVDPYNLPDSTLGEMLRAHFDSAVAVGKNAESEYQASLARLRGQRDEAALLVVGALERAPTEAYFERALMAETLRELASPNTLDRIYRIALEPRREAKSIGDDHHFFPGVEESQIRAITVRAIAEIAKVDPTAEELLLKLAQDDDISVAREAIQGFLGLGDADNRRKMLGTVLDSERIREIGITTTDPKSVPYPDELLNDIPLPAARPKDSPEVSDDDE